MKESIRTLRRWNNKVIADFPPATILLEICGERPDFRGREKAIGGIDQTLELALDVFQLSL